MSFAYMPNGGIPICQRCRMLLSSGEPRCNNCGYYNVSLPGNQPASSMPTLQYPLGQGQAQGLQGYRSFSPIMQRRKRPNVGLLIGIAVLLIAVIVGSVIGYTLLSSRTSNRSDTSNMASVPSTFAPKGKPLFSDAFTNNNNQWNIQSYPGEFSVTVDSGALALENDNNKLLWELVPGDKSYSDFQLSVDAMLSKGTQGNGYGLYIRSALSQNTALSTYYRFELYGDGSYAIFKGIANANGDLSSTRLVDYTNSSAIQKQGGLNHIMVVAKGSTLQLVVNGQTLSSISDTSYARGRVALFVSNLQKAPPRARATFSHFAIYPPQN